MRSFILFSLFGIASTLPYSPPRIVGGQPASAEEFPFVTNLQWGLLGLFYYQMCTGALITATTVLTSAGCLRYTYPEDWRVVTGSTLTSGSDGNFNYVSSLSMHSGFNPSTMEHDAGILRLQAAAVFSSRVAAARIAGATYVLPDDTVLATAGFGSLSDGGEIAEHLKHTTVNIVNNGICAARYEQLLAVEHLAERVFPVTPGMVCNGLLDVGGAGACLGDLGGPLVHDGDVVVGINSWSLTCGHPLYPNVATLVSGYAEWIVNNA